MADWEAVSRGISRGFERGVATGGKLSGLGQIISKVADRLKSQRELGEQLNLLGQTERIKAQYTPKEWKPTTKEEALSFEREKAGIKTTEESKKRLRLLQDKAATKGWELNVGADLSPERQTEVARKLIAIKSGEGKEITKTSAVNILSDPFKARQIKSQFPELYKELIQRAGINKNKKSFLKEELDTEMSDIMDTNW